MKIKITNTGKRGEMAFLYPVLVGVEAFWKAIRQHTPQSLSMPSFEPIRNFQKKRNYSKYYFIIRENKVLFKI